MLGEEGYLSYWGSWDALRHCRSDDDCSKSSFVLQCNIILSLADEAFFKICIGEQKCNILHEFTMSLTLFSWKNIFFKLQELLHLLNFNEVYFIAEDGVFSHVITRCLSPGDKSKPRKCVLNPFLREDLSRLVHDLPTNDHAALVMSFCLVWES